MRNDVKFSIIALDLFERPVRLRLPFRFGAALVDRAILDAVCRALETNVAAAVQNNVPAIDATLAPDLREFAFDRYLAALMPASTVAARHTVGLLDPLASGNVAARPDDDLPVALDEVIARYGNRHFKLKLAGDVAQDIERLTQIATVLDALPQYMVTL